MDDLLRIGFRHIGNWELNAKGLKLALEDLQEASPALYAFVVDEEVKYVGKTKRTLGQRLYGYCKPGPTQRTNERIRDEIVDALRNGKKVGVLGFPDPGTERLGPFRVNLAAGLEDDIIAQLHPDWNGGRVTKSGAEKYGEDTTRLANKIQPSHPVDESTPPRSRNISVSVQPHFAVTIGKTYYSQGFFNVPVNHERYFAKDGAQIQIECSGLSHTLTGTINRTVNKTYAPRIRGGVPLRDWF